MNFYAIFVLFCYAISATSAEDISETVCIGSVTASSLFIRLEPSTAAEPVGSLFEREVVSIEARAIGDTVHGHITTSNWFYVRNGWVSAAYISVSEANVPWCAAREAPGYCYGYVQASTLYIRAQPNTLSAIVGTLSYMDMVVPIGSVAGEVINGNQHWFVLPSGYIASTYVWITGKSETEDWCAPI